MTDVFHWRRFRKAFDALNIKTFGELAKVNLNELMHVNNFSYGSKYDVNAVLPLFSGVNKKKRNCAISVSTRRKSANSNLSADEPPHPEAVPRVSDAIALRCPGFKKKSKKQKRSLKSN